jgi:diguanylate cyclase (GGDEF)-like protein/PAS domain S-box-containing protein
VSTRRLRRVIYLVALACGALDAYAFGPSPLALCLSSLPLIVAYLVLRRPRQRPTSAGDILAALPQAYVVLDADGHVLELNRRFCELAGAGRDDLVGKPPPLGGWPVQTRSLGTVERELSLSRRDGSAVTVLAQQGALRLPGGGPTGSVWTFTDIGHRAAGEAEARGQADEWHARADEETALQRTARAIASEAAPEAVFALVAEEAARLLEADAGAVISFDGRAPETTAWWVDGSRTGPAAPRSLDGCEALTRLRRSGGAARDDDCVAAPVRVGGRLFGAVVVLASDGVAERGESVLNRFGELAALAVVAAEARRRLADRAATDPLTGLANHRTFHETLRVEVERARRNERDLALVVFDLDHFKRVNDLLGHQAGDRVLAEVGRRLQAQARTGETLARIGGEEFAWILPDTDGFEAWHAAERAREAIATVPFAEAGSFTVSTGVCDLEQAADAQELLRLGDGALYWAKAHGRNTTVRYLPKVVKELSAQERIYRLERSQALTSLRVLARAVDAKDPLTQRHSERVAALAGALARAQGWPAERVALLHDAGLVHDVGKIGIPDAILLKPGALTPEEYEEVKAHALLGAQILSDVLEPEQVAWIRHHHERHDGKGYPDGLRASAVPEGSRLLAVADAWDVLTSDRSYHQPKSATEALAECRREAGTQLDPEAVAALVRLFASGELVRALGRPVREELRLPA